MKYRIKVPYTPLGLEQRPCSEERLSYREQTNTAGDTSDWFVCNIHMRFG